MNSVADLMVVFRTVGDITLSLALWQVLFYVLYYLSLLSNSVKLGLLTAANLSLPLGSLRTVRKVK